MPRRIIAYGGGGFLMERARSRLDEFFARTTGVRQPRICFVGTAAGDGGNTRSMLAVWREWGLDRILRKAWDSGVLFGGMSAGAICWFEHGATASVLGSGRSSALSRLGFLPGSCCPHFDGEPHRRGDFRRLIAEGALPPGIGTDDGAAVLFSGTGLVELVASREGATAYRLAPGRDRMEIQSLPARLLKPARK